MKEIKTVGVVGCGLMGSGIVQVCARSGYDVLVSDADASLLKKGLASVKESLQRAVEKGRLSSDEKDDILGRITGTTDIADFKYRDLVIEAAIENLDLKKKIFAALDGACPAHAILATNTSCLPVGEMAAATKRPDRVLGLHFFNPPPVMALLEIVRTAFTSEETFRAGKAFGESLGKTVVVVGDSPGFIVNRLMIPQILDAIRLRDAGTASVEDIDTAMKLGLNYPMGPLALADFIGLDTVLFIADGIYDKQPDDRYAAPASLRDMVARGQLGRKTEHGYYKYS